MILFCGIVYLKLWFSFISNLHNSQGPPSQFIGTGGKLVATQLISRGPESRGGAWPCWRAFSCFPVYSLWCQPHYMTVPTFKARLPPSSILSGNLYTSVFLNPIKVTCRLFCELSLGRFQQTSMHKRQSTDDRPT